MWSRDLLRVLQGAGKVAEQITKSQGPDLSASASRLAKHAVELTRVAPHLFGSADSTHTGSTASMQQDSGAATSSAQTDDAVATPLLHPPPPATPAQQDASSSVAHAINATTQQPNTAIHDRLRSTAAFKPQVTAPARTPMPSPTPSPAPVVTEPPLHKPTTDASADHEYGTVQAMLARSKKHEQHEQHEQYKQHEQHKQHEHEHPFAEAMQAPDAAPHAWTEKHVPSSPLSRILGFGGLAAKLAVGTAAEIVRSGGKSGTYSALVSDANVEKLAETLCTMRGAALKLGQMLSIQDENLIPPKLAAALDRVRQNAHVMPKAQLHEQLAAELGENWRDHFSEFDDNPIAAASIGQVHRATLQTGERVAIKIQYPGVADSIESDLLNLKRLVTYTNILPRGLYIDEIIRVGQEELTAECDYIAEATNQELFRELVAKSDMTDGFVVPRVHRNLSTARVLTTELISGAAIDKATHLSQDVRNSIARRILELTIRELFDWRFMQTDPNWSNFMYNAARDKIGLIDFGAARHFDKAFVDQYFTIVWAAANCDEPTMERASIAMKFLTGDESPAMLRAHMAAGMVVGEPFRDAAPFDFYASELTKRLGQHTETFMHGRLTPPPQEAYSLHRKLAGAFLMCIKLRAVVPCRDVLERVHAEYVAEQQAQDKKL